MNRYCAPEFRGKIRGQCGQDSPANSAPLFLTNRVIFLFLAGTVWALHAVLFSVAAAPNVFRAPPSSCAVPFDLRDVDGRVHALAGQRGRPVLVHFFATWCEPCKTELGSLRRFVDGRASALQVLAVSVGEVPGRVRRFLDDTPVNFPVLLDADRAVAKSWGVEGLPTTIVLDRTLTPRLAVSGELDWTRADVGGEIDRVLAQAPTPDPSPTIHRDNACTREARR
jgi:peroxiredoxin